LHQSASSTAKTPFLTYSFRGTSLLMHILTGVIFSAALLPLCSKQKKLTIIQWWSTRLLSIFNIQVKTEGHTPIKQNNNMGVMFVANHISWVDIHALMSITPLRFIAKSDIRQWPVFGYLAAKANVLFIDREKRHDAARIVGTAVNSLKDGDQLCFFPEGTTTDGTHMLPFKSSLIQAAIEAQTVIQPVAIFYPNTEQSANTQMAYAGKTSMLESMQTILREQSPIVEIYFFAPINLNVTSDEMKNRQHLTKLIFNLIHDKLYRIASK
jgi:1-acyl-sn-glycerol-3-phosphate acyltransferase